VDQKEFAQHFDPGLGSEHRQGVKLRTYEKALHKGKHDHLGREFIFGPAEPTLLGTRLYHSAKQRAGRAAATFARFAL
jgi:hypothetical protein